MPISYQIDRGRCLIRTQCYGLVTLDEVMEYFRLLVQDSNCPPRLSVLLDLSESTNVPESEQLRAVSNQIGQIRKLVQFDACAIVASGDIMFGMARMFAVFAESSFRITSVFRTLDEAEKWLAMQRSPASSSQTVSRPDSQQTG